MKILSDIRKEYDFTQSEAEIISYLPKIIDKLKQFQIDFTKTINHLEDKDPDLWTELNMSLHSQKNKPWFNSLITYALKSENVDILQYFKTNNFFPDINEEIFTKASENYLKNASNDDVKIIENLYIKNENYFSSLSYKTINYKLSSSNIEKLLELSGFNEKKLENDVIFSEIFHYACLEKNFVFLDTLLNKAMKFNVEPNGNSMTDFILRKILTNSQEELQHYLLSKIDFTGYSLNQYMDKNNINKNEPEKYYFVVPNNEFLAVKNSLLDRSYISEIQKILAEVEEKRNATLEKEKLIESMKTYEGNLFFKDLTKKMKTNIQEVYQLIKNEEVGLKNYFKNENHNIMSLLETYFISLNDLLLFNQENYLKKQFDHDEKMLKVAKDNELFPVLINHFFQSIEIASIKQNPSEYLSNQAMELANDLSHLNKHIETTGIYLKEQMENIDKTKSAEKSSTRKKI